MRAPRGFKTNEGLQFPAPDGQHALKRNSACDYPASPLSFHHPAPPTTLPILTPHAAEKQSVREARAMFLVRIWIGQFMLEVKVEATSQRATTRTAPCSSCLARVRGGVGEGGKGGNRGGTVRERRVIQARKDTIPGQKKPFH